MRAAARGLRAAPPACAARSAARTDIPSRVIRFASRLRVLVVGQREHGPRMPLGQLAAGDHPEHLLRELEQPQPVRDGRLRAADSLRDLAERELELVHERGVGARLLDRRQLLAGDVLDEREQERVAVVRLAYDGRQRREPRLARGTPAALAGDQLVAARRTRPDDDRLQQTLLLDRAREAGRRLGLEAPARLARVRVDRVDGQVRELLLRRARRRRSALRGRGRGRAALC